MRIQCPHCGKSVVVNRIGRKPLNIGVKIVSDALKAYPTVSAAALELGCSRGYIYKVLSKQGMKPGDVISGVRAESL